MRQPEHGGRKCVRPFWNTICFYWHFQFGLSWPILQRKTVSLSDSPSGASLVQHTKEEQLLGGEAGRETSVRCQVSYTPVCSWPKWLLSLLVWSCTAVSSLLTSIPAFHLADRICKRKRSQLRPRLFSKISNFLCSRQQDSAYMRVPEHGCASGFRFVRTCDQARQKVTDKLHFEQGLPVVSYLQNIPEWM